MTGLERLRAAYPPLPDPAPPAATVARLQALYASSDGAAAPDTGAGRKQRRWPPRRTGLLAIGAVIVTGTALAATIAWHPVLGSGHRPRPVAANAPVPADQLDALAVLRRPQTAIDRGPIVRLALRHLDRRLINGIHTDAIRVIYQSPRELVTLIPVERSGQIDAGLPRPTRNVLCLVSSSYAHARTMALPSGHKWHLPKGYAGWGAQCGGLDMLRTTGIATSTTADGSGGIMTGPPTHLTLHRVTLVPDGVARVKVRLRHGRSITVPVHNNAYRYTVHYIPIQLGTIWYDATGHRINHHEHP